jgi:hypothetical protein
MLQNRRGEGRQNGSAAAFAKKADERSVGVSDERAERAATKEAMRKKLAQIEASNNRAAHQALAKARKEREAKAAATAAASVGAAGGRRLSERELEERRLAMEERDLRVMRGEAYDDD